MFEQPRETVNREALRKLFVKKYFERMTENSDSIIEVLKNGNNQELLNLIGNYVHSNNGKVSLEDLSTYLEATVYDTDSQIVSAIGISKDPEDFTALTVDTQTYENLQKFTVDPEIVRAEVKNQLSDAV
jgi:hypothetical protein